MRFTVTFNNLYYFKLIYNINNIKTQFSFTHFKKIMDYFMMN